MEPDRPAPESDHPPSPAAPATGRPLPSPVPPAAGPLAVARTILWSFFGVRRRSGSDADVASISLAQVVIGGIIGVLILIACLVALVIFVTRT